MRSSVGLASLLAPTDLSYSHTLRYEVSWLLNVWLVNVAVIAAYWVRQKSLCAWRIPLDCVSLERSLCEKSLYTARVLGLIASSLACRVSPMYESDARHISSGPGRGGMPRGGIPP